MPQAVPPQPTLYEKHLEAAKEWHEACHAYQAASDRRMKAEKALHDVSNQLAAALQQVLHDPTQANDMQPSVPMAEQAYPGQNGLLQGSAPTYAQIFKSR